MANKLLRQDSTDERMIAEKFELYRVFGGFDKSAGRNADDALLPYVPGGMIWLSHTTVTATDSINFGDVPGRMYIKAVHVADVLAAGTITLALENLSGSGGPSAATLCTTQSLTAVGPVTTTETYNSVTRKLTGTLASATTGAEFWIGLEVYPLDKAWR